MHKVSASAASSLHCSHQSSYYLHVTLLVFLKATPKRFLCAWHSNVHLLAVLYSDWYILLDVDLTTSAVVSISEGWIFDYLCIHRSYRFSNHQSQCIFEQHKLWLNYSGVLDGEQQRVEAVLVQRKKHIKKHKQHCFVLDVVSSFGN